MKQLIDKLKSIWTTHDLVTTEGNCRHTFLEDVANASAENVRSAALRRWINRHGNDAREWINSVSGGGLTADPITAVSEKTLGPGSRIDLQINQAGVPSAFIEVKWALLPSHEQLQRYRTAIDLHARNKNKPLILVSPVRLALSGNEMLPSLTFPTDWLTLTDYLSHDSTEDGSVEQDLSRTLVRWRELQCMLRSEIRSCNIEFTQFCNLVEWLAGEAGPSMIPAPTEYADLTRLLIVSEFADALVDRNMAHSLRRCGASFGAHGDVQSDVCKIDGSWFPCEGDPTCGVEVVVRFHVNAEFHTMEVNVGSHVLPYRVGKDKTSWVEAEGDLWDEISRKARNVRRELHAVLRQGSFIPVGNPDKLTWYQCSFSHPFTENENVGCIFEYAARVCAAIGKLEIS